MKNEKTGIQRRAILSNALIVASLLLAACAAKPPPVGKLTSSVPTSTYPVHIASDGPVGAPSVVRTGRAYRLTVNGGLGPLPVAEANVPILLPTLVAPDAIGYFELDGPLNRFFIQDLSSGQRQADGYGNSEAACSVELKAARSALEATPSPGWSDAQASRGAEGACRDAFVKVLVRVRFEAAQKMLRERRLPEAKAALLAFVATYPDDSAVAQALFSAGAADYAARNYRSASELFRQSAAVPNAPQGRAAEALLAAADCELEMGRPSQSLADLAQLVRRYPLTAAAAVANQRIAYEKKPFAFQEMARDVDKPRFAIEPSIAYPPLSRRLGEQGAVTVSAVVDTEGVPREISVATSSRYERLDEAALDSVRKVHFFPARSPSGQKKAVRMDVPIRFVLNP
jgi:TonB family protein